VSGRTFTVADAVAASRDGKVSAVEYVEACLDRIREADGRIEAWAALDPDHVRMQARRLDEMRSTGRPMGPLHGIPVAVDDIFDTADLPTEDGTALHAGRKPMEDASAVSLLRQAGALVIGKTATAELGVYGPGKTRNPHDRNRIAGMTSGGAAAAVGAGMTPLAISLTSGGSILEAASYCGLVGFKPSHGSISRYGALRLSRVLDQVGVFATGIADAALLAETLMAYDPADPDLRPEPRPALVRIAAEEPPLPPRLAFVKTPAWGEAEQDAKAAFAELAEFLGDGAAEWPLPPVFEDAAAWHRTIFEADAAVSLQPDYARGKARMSAALRATMARGGRVLASDYIKAVARIPLLNRELAMIFDRYDAILTPATQGEAPLHTGRAGDAVFCRLWTLLGVPAITLPLLQGANRLPIGVQLVGRRGDDARLLRTARWLSELVLAPKKARRAKRSRAS
jgi:Asp-tRNA(Asn)/Glu-tRNA(Gln) amidotransferase A subunit family amidase